MTFKVDERIRETSTTTGVGTYTVVGPPTGFQSASSIGANNYMPYWATDGVNWEAGIGRYLAGPDRLERTHILASSNADAAVDWGVGTRTIRCHLPAWLALPRTLSKAVGGGAGTTVLSILEQRATYIDFTGVLTGNRVIEVDDTPCTRIIFNNTTGAFTLTLRVTGQAGVVIPVGRAMTYVDGDVRLAQSALPGVLARAANTILTAADRGKTISATTSFTQTFDPAAALVDGWSVGYRNNGAGVITLDPNAAETIDGAATKLLQPGESCVIVSTGAALITLGLEDINALTAEAAALDATNDFLRIYDASAPGHRKMAPTSFVSLLNASQAQQEAGAVSGALVSPANQHHHPSACKGWVLATTNGVANASYNVTSVTDNGTGDAAINWNADFSSASYCAVYTNVADGANIPQAANTGYAAGSTRVTSRDVGNNLTDPNLHSCAVFGDQ